MDGTWDPRELTKLEKFVQDVREAGRGSRGYGYAYLRYDGFEKCTPEQFQTVITVLERDGGGVTHLSTALPETNRDIDRYLRTILGRLPALKLLSLSSTIFEKNCVALLLCDALKICRLTKLELVLRLEIGDPRKVLELVGAGVGAGNSIEELALDIPNMTCFDVGECIVGFTAGLLRSGNTSFRRLILECRGGPLENRIIHLSVHGLFRCCKYLAGLAGKQRSEKSILDILGTISRQTNSRPGIDTAISTEDELSTTYTIIRRRPDLTAWDGFDMLNVPPLQPPAAAASFSSTDDGFSSDDDDFSSSDDDGSPPPGKRPKLCYCGGGSAAYSSPLERELASVKRENKTLQRRIVHLERQLDVARRAGGGQHQHQRDDGPIGTRTRLGTGTSNPITPNPPRRTTRKRGRKEGH